MRVRIVSFTTVEGLFTFSGPAEFVETGEQRYITLKREDSRFADKIREANDDYLLITTRGRDVIDLSGLATKIDVS